MTGTLTLTLSWDEAEVLRSLLHCHVSGTGRSRDLLSDISTALAGFGLTAMPLPCDPYSTIVHLTEG